MAKKQTKLVRNPVSQKHKANLKAKDKKRQQMGSPVCTSCGKTSCSCGDEKLVPGDLGYVNAVMRGGVSLATPKWTTTSSTWVGPRNVKVEPLVIPDFLMGVAREMSLQSQLPLDCLEYRGRSKRLGAKSGKRKLAESHYFVVKHPITHQVNPEGDVKHLWHGSPLRNTSGILTSGLKPSFGGLLGKGVYLGEIRKALSYAHKSNAPWGLMLYCRLALGRVVEAGSEHKPHDTVYCPRGNLKRAWSGFVLRDEWCVRDPDRITILEIHLIPKSTLMWW